MWTGPQVHPVCFSFILTRVLRFYLPIKSLAGLTSFHSEMQISNFINFVPLKPGTQNQNGKYPRCYLTVRNPYPVGRSMLSSKAVWTNPLWQGTESYQPSTVIPRNQWETWRDRSSCPSQENKGPPEWEGVHGVVQGRQNNWVPSLSKVDEKCNCFPLTSSSLPSPNPRILSQTYQENQTYVLKILKDNERCSFHQTMKSSVTERHPPHFTEYDMPFVIQHTLFYTESREEKTWQL